MSKPIPLCFEMYPAERRATILRGRYTQADHAAAAIIIVGDDDAEAPIAVTAADHPALWGLLVAANFQLAPFLTITAAQYGNAERTAALIDTVEAARKAISAADTPELWAQLQEWAAAGNSISDYAPPPSAPPPDLATIKAQLTTLQDAIAVIEAADAAAVAAKA